MAEDKIQELMKPRFKVIAGWPGSKFEVGEIISGEGTTETQKRAGIFQSNITAHGINVGHCEDYPHLFKRLEWWEERKPEEMPEYVTINNRKKVHKVEYFTQGLSPFTGFAKLKGVQETQPWDRLLPATESEYQSKQKEQP